MRRCTNRRRRSSDKIEVRNDGGDASHSDVQLSQQLLQLLMVMHTEVTTLERLSEKAGQQFSEMMGRLADLEDRIKSLENDSRQNVVH